MDDASDVGRVVDEFFLYMRRATPATEKGAQAFDRLLRLAEHHALGRHRSPGERRPALGDEEDRRARRLAEIVDPQELRHAA